MRRRDFLGVALGALAARAAFAQQAPEIVVPFVPTPQVTVDEMLRIAGVGPGDFVLDLGSGDGRIVITAAKKFGARGLGVDLDHHLVIQSEDRKSTRLNSSHSQISYAVFCLKK